MVDFCNFRCGKVLQKSICELSAISFQQSAFGSWLGFQRTWFVTIVSGVIIPVCGGGFQRFSWPCAGFGFRGSGLGLRRETRNPRPERRILLTAEYADSRRETERWVEATAVRSERCHCVERLRTVVGVRRTGGERGSPCSKPLVAMATPTPVRMCGEGWQSVVRTRVGATRHPLERGRRRSPDLAETVETYGRSRAGSGDPRTAVTSDWATRYATSFRSSLYVRHMT